MKSLKIFSFISVLAIFMCGSGCTSLKRDYSEPQSPSLDQDYFADVFPERFDIAQPIADWWTYFNDPVLTKLVDQAIKNNLDVRASILRVEKLSLAVNEERASRLPIAEGDADYTAERISKNNRSSSRSIGNRDFDTYSGALTAAWETDLFGRLSYRIDREKALLGQQRADLYGVYVSIASEVAQAYLELRGTRRQLAIDLKNEANQARTYELTKALAEAGRATKLDIERALTQLELTRATIAPLRARIQEAAYRLGLLTGRHPDALREELADDAPLPTIEKPVIVGDPASLLRRRPDIIKAEYRVKEALADYNYSVAEIFPEITLSGSVGFISGELSNLMTRDSMTASVSPTIKWRLLDLYRVKSEIDQNDLETKARLLEYEQTVLRALYEVKSALENFAAEEKRRNHFAEAAKSGAEASRIARERYEAGLDDFLDILVAERTQLSAEDGLAQSATLSALRLVDIYTTLGGGWENQKSRNE